jgi:hypothetical protein
MKRFLGLLHSHSHRGFSPVVSQRTRSGTVFNGFLFAVILLACLENR